MAASIAKVQTKSAIKKTKVCSICTYEKKIADFYVADSTIFEDGRVPMCKSCFKKMSIDDDGCINIDNMKMALQIMNKPFIESVLETAIDTVNTPGTRRKDVLGEYMRMINSLPQNTSVNFVDSLTENVPQKQEQISPATLRENQSETIFYSEVWRGHYTERDIKYLDSYYEDLNKDYKIVTGNHRDYARKIAKASLQMDNAFEEVLQNVAGSETRYAKARETFDALCKSAKFSEGTRSVNDVGISGFAKVAEMVEAHNWIPKHVVMEKDEIDKMLDYLSTITKSL